MATTVGKSSWLSLTRMRSDWGKKKKKKTKWTYRVQQYNLSIVFCDVATNNDHGDIIYYF